MLNPKALSSTGKILFADVPKAQQIESVKPGSRKKDTVCINVPFGTTGRIQTLGVCINKPFKCYIGEKIEKHL